MTLHFPCFRISCSSCATSAHLIILLPAYLYLVCGKQQVMGQTDRPIHAHASLSWFEWSGRLKGDRAWFSLSCSPCSLLLSWRHSAQFASSSLCSLLAVGSELAITWRMGSLWRKRAFAHPAVLFSSTRQVTRPSLSLTFLFLHTCPIKKKGGGSDGESGQALGQLGNWPTGAEPLFTSFDAFICCFTVANSHIQDNR